MADSCHCDHSDGDHSCTCKHKHASCKCKGDGRKHHCRCEGHEAHHEEGSGAGFAFGVALGALAATLLAPDEGKNVRDKAKKKYDDLIGSKSGEELLEQIKDVVSSVMEDVREVADAGVTEAKQTKRRVQDSARKRKQ